MKGCENNKKRRLLQTNAYLKIGNRIRRHVKEGFGSSLKQNQLMGG